MKIIHKATIFMFCPISLKVHVFIYYGPIQEFAHVQKCSSSAKDSEKLDMQDDEFRAIVEISLEQGRL